MLNINYYLQILETDVGKNLHGAKLNILLSYICALEKNTGESQRFIKLIQEKYSEEYQTEEVIYLILSLIDIRYR